jgi:hypothetical protein
MPPMGLGWVSIERCATTTMRGAAVTAATEYDQLQRDVVADLAGEFRDWFLFWGVWRRTFTAIALWTNEDVVIEESSRRKLVAGIRQAESERRTRARRRRY